MTTLVSHPLKITENGLRGTARVPGDKSISHRALILGALAEGVTKITGLLEGEDVLRTARALMALGVTVTPSGSRGGIWEVGGIGNTGLKAPRSALYLGNSGTSARLMMGAVGSYPITAAFLGDESLSRRPMGRAIKPLAQMGVQFEMGASGDKLPIRVIGSPALAPIEYVMPVSSAQVKSAILLAALRANGETTIIEPIMTRDHTERMLRHFGATVETQKDSEGHNHIRLQGGQKLYGQDLSVPGDPSAAAFLTVAALITPGSDIVIPHVSVNPLRAGLYTTLQEMGGDITLENRRETSSEPAADIRVRYSELKGVTVPPERVASMIDEFPILGIAAAFAEGKTDMSNLGELLVKESDRLAALAEGLTAAGVKVYTNTADAMTIYGTGAKPRGGCAIKTQDHRIAMSFLIMGMATQSPITVDGTEMITTSFPDFAQLMNDLGAKMEEPEV